MNINSNEPSFYPYSVKISKCSDICNNINDPYGKLCVPDVSKNMNLKVFNLISWTNETRSIKLDETCKCKCRLDASACNNKQRWSEDKCRCESTESVDKGICNKGFDWNPSKFNCECDKSCNVREYLDSKNSKCRKRLVDKLVEECSSILEKKDLHPNKRIYNSALNNYEKTCSSCTIYHIISDHTYLFCWTKVYTCNNKGFIIDIWNFKISIYFIFMYFYFFLYVFIIMTINRFTIKFHIQYISNSFPYLGLYFWQFVIINLKIYCLITFKVFTTSNHLRKHYA